MAKKDPEPTTKEPEQPDAPSHTSAPPRRPVRVTFAGYADWAGSAASVAVGAGQRWQPEFGEFGVTFSDGARHYFVPWTQIKFVELTEVKAS